MVENAFGSSASLAPALELLETILTSLRHIGLLVYSTPAPRYPNVCADVAHNLFGESLCCSIPRAA